MIFPQKKSRIKYKLIFMSYLLIAHFRKEADANEPDFRFGIVGTKFVVSFFEVVGLTLSEEVENFVLVFGIDYVVEIVADVDFRS